MIEKCIAKFSRNHFSGKKVTSKTQEIIAKYLKQSDLRLFEGIWVKGEKIWVKGGKKFE